MKMLLEIPPTVKFQDTQTPGKSCLLRRGIRVKPKCEFISGAFS